MIIHIEDYFGDTIGAVRVTENDMETGELKVLETIGYISIADIDFDMVVHLRFIIAYVPHTVWRQL